MARLTAIILDSTRPRQNRHSLTGGCRFRKMNRPEAWGLLVIGQTVSHYRIVEKLGGGGMGFVQPNDRPVTGLDLKVERAAVEAARRNFSPEFMNRLDKVVVFHPLRRDHLEQVLEIELGQVQQRLFEAAKGQFLLRVTGPGREFLLQEGTDHRYGARHLKRAIERHLVSPLANLLATDQVHLGDLVCIDWGHSQDRLTFIREGDDLALPARCLEPAAPARSVPARTGKFVEGPAVTLTPESSPCVAW